MTMEVHKLDLAIQKAFPTILAPKFGALQPLAINGVRYIIAANGFWREVKLPWLDVCHRVGSVNLQLPYGEAKGRLELLCSPIPMELMAKFKDDAVRALPNEMAAALIWNEATDTWRYQEREPLEQSAAYVKYAEVKLAQGEHLVVDLHSHALFEAFFSATDDHDDAGSMRFSGVIGNLDQEKRSFCLRLNLAGMAWPAELRMDGTMEVL